MINNCFRLFRYMTALLLLSCSTVLFAKTEIQWETTGYIWKFNFAMQSDVGLCYCPKDYFLSTDFPFNPHAYHPIPEGGLVWMRASHVPDFYAWILPTLKTPCVLVLNDSTDSFPSSYAHKIDVEKLIEHPYILHIFAQNCDYQGKSSKVSHLPLGLDFHSVAYKGGMWGEKGSPQEQEVLLDKILAQLSPTYERHKKAFVDFQHNETMNPNPRYQGESRKAIFDYFKDTGLVDHGPKMARSALWKLKGQYAFSISPHGNGLDCHRTWEDLLLGCIVIVKTSPLDPLYEGLPVVIVKDWEEVTQENMERWLDQYGDAFTNPHYREKLTNVYWLNKMRATARQALHKLNRHP